MKKNLKYSAAVGILLFILAALSFISLLSVAFDFGGISTASNTVFYTLGKMLTGVYGFCSICIPIFLMAAGIQCFIPKWRIKNGVLLVGSIIPFFTLDAIEHICRMIAETDTRSVLMVKTGATLFVGCLVISVEYLLLSIFGEALEFSFSANAEFNETPDLAYSEPGEDEVQIFGDETDSEYAREQSKNEEEQSELSRKEEIIDLATDEIFLQQKEILKDLINDGKSRADEDATITDERTILPSVGETENFDAEETIPESVSEDEILDEENFIEPKLPDEPSPFDHIFDEQEKLHEEETKNLSEKNAELVVENTNEAPAEIKTEKTIENAFKSEEPYSTSAEENFNQEQKVSDIAIPDNEDEDFFLDEEQLPINSEDFIDSSDFANEYDEMGDVSPVTFDEELFDEVPNDVGSENPASDSAELISEESYIAEQEKNEPVTEFEEVEAETFENHEEDFKPNYEDNPADFINIEDIAESSDDDTFVTDADDSNIGIEDIFSQMEADAATNPIFKSQEPPAPVDSLYQQSEVMESEPEIEFEDKAESNEPVLEEEPVDENEGYEEEGESEEEIEIEKVPEPSEEEAKSEPSTTRKLSNYKIPTDLLEKFENAEFWRIDDETKLAGENLKKTLNEFGIEAEVTGIRKGPVVTMFELLPAPGVKLSKIVNLQDNIALSLAAKSVRIVAPIPGRHAVGIEIPNKERAIVSFREIIEQPLPEYKKMSIPVILGKDISGQSQIIDIAKTPHLLIAGATGAGKSVCVNSIILSILYNRSPNDVKLIMVDPKVVELKLYNDIPHLLTPVVTEPKRALQVLQYCICEMERRYALLDGMGVRDIVSYNTRIRERKIATEKLPYIVVIIDEFADLMATSGKELETSVARLTAMSRAVGIHLVLATQRPSVNVITGLIKANIPSRIAFMVASRTDSNIIIDSVGAEKLLGKGDMLYTSAVNPIPTRIQGTLVSDNEVENVVDYVKTFGGPDYIDDEIFVDDDEEINDEPGLFSDGEDPLYDQALQIVIQAGKASASYIQRRLKIGYNRAARLVEEMEERGIVGPANGSKPREVIHIP